MDEWIFAGVKFNVGDRVKIVRKVDSRSSDGMGMGRKWENSWVKSMDDTIGEVATIDGISSAGAYFQEFSLGYPLMALEKLDSVTIPTGQFQLVGKDGTIYSAEPSAFGHTWVEWKFAPSHDDCGSTVLNSDLIAYVQSGFWSIQKSALQLANEAKLAALKEQSAILINEIDELEKEIADGN